MNRCLAATQVSVVLSLNIVVRDDQRGVLFRPVPILAITGFFYLLWQAWRAVQVIRLDLEVLGVDLAQTIDVWVRVLGIGVSAVRFGIG